MNRWTSSLLVAGLLAGLCSTAPATGQDSTERRVAREVDEPEGYGLMLTPAVMDKLLDRIVEKMGQDFQFDEAQARDAQRVFKENVLRFIKENQKDFTKLANEFLDKRLGTEPPTPEEVAEWAQRAQPMLERTRTFVTKVSDEMREFMTDEQQIKMDASLAAFEVASNFLDRRLSNWSEGGFNAATEWPRNPGVQKFDDEQAYKLQLAMEDARRDKLGLAPRQPADPQAAEPVVPVGSTPEAAASATRDAQPVPAAKGAAKAEPKDEWTKYVEAFIAKYNLDATQAQKAMVHLNDATRKRDEFLRTKGRQMEQLEKSFKSAGTPDAVKAAEAQYQALMQPVDRMFEKLKEKLDGLPNREQRRKAAAESGDAEKYRPAAAEKP